MSLSYQVPPSALPCVVLGLETQIGLHIVRELGRAGVRVIGIASSPHSIGLKSRYLHEGIVCTEPRGPSLLKLLRDLGERHGACPLLTVSEGNLIWLNAHRDQLGNLRPQIPSPERLELVLDKQRTLALAREVGILTPTSEQPRSEAEALALADRFRWPAVVKWADPPAVSSRLRALGLPLVKAEYVYDADQWRSLVRRYAPLGEWPLLQSYCAGQGLGQFFFMHDGQAKRRFQHLRVAEWPPEGGFSCVCDALPLEQHEALQSQSIELLRRIGWEGVAMVEYRWDPARNEAVLMEINGRFWGSFPLAAQAGAGFALLSYLHGCGLPLPELPPPRQRLRCRLLGAEIKRLGRVVIHPERIADKAFRVQRLQALAEFLLNFVRPGVRYYVASWQDPRPWLADLRNLWRRS